MNPAPVTSSEDLALLRRFEPVLRYTRGERFFPMDASRFVEQSSLWVQLPDRTVERLVPQGELTLEKLIEPRRHGFGAVYFLKFIEQIDLVEMARDKLNQAVKVLTGHADTDIFRAGRGRLARVGYLSRFLDALFSLTLFLRGRVPGDTAAAAGIAYRRLQRIDERYCYYGRVVRENGWLALQYWYFYPFNNWRSGFFGVNDHEGDWEMVCLYCSEDHLPSGGCVVEPQWLAYASHEFWGDDLRRRWDDPEVQKVGEHPVIYVGAGSHASYFSQGEYLIELELPFLAPLVRLADRIQAFWVGVLRQSGIRASSPEFNIFRIPFVDYARGDGMVIGENGLKHWQALSLDPTPEWIKKYRGLWGLFAQDPISGEDAPAGPMYNRDGSVRRSWYDPLGWAGLDKVPPPDESLGILQRQRAQARARCAELRRKIDEKQRELSGLGLINQAILNRPHLENLYASQAGRIQSLSHELNHLRRDLTIEEAKLEALDLHENSLRSGERGPLRAHIRRAHRPSSEIDLRMGRLAEGFAAVSVGLLLISIVALIVFARHYLLFGLAAMIGALIFIESGFRRQLTRLVTSLTIALAIVTAFVLLFEFFWQAVVALVLITGVYLMWENFRELRS